MEIWRNPNVSQNGTRQLVCHQTGYCSHIVKEFEKLHNGGRPLRPLDAPMFVHEQRGKEEQDGAPEATARCLQHRVKEAAAESRLRSRECRAVSYRRVSAQQRSIVYTTESSQPLISRTY